MIFIKGHSTSKINIYKDNGNFYLCKTDIDNPDRLKLQKKKQIFFDNLIRNNKLLSILFEVPRVYNSESFIMDYYNGYSFLDVIEYGKSSDLDKIVSSIISYLDWEFNNSEVKNIDIIILKEKVDSIIKACNFDNELIQAITSTINNLDSISLPIGLCHGDLTFSNMIFTDKIILIDFLNNYIESPIQDICKLFQDIYLYWTMLMSEVKRDCVKIHIGYEYVKQKLESIIYMNLNKWNINKNILNIFYMITILRLFPYIRNFSIYNKSLKELHRILKII